MTNLFIFEPMEKDKINPRNLMTVTDFALFIGKSRQTVFNWVKEGRVEKRTYLGREWIDKSTLKQVA